MINQEQTEDTRLFAAAIQEFNRQGMPYKIVHDHIGTGLEFTCNSYTYSYYPFQAQLIDQQREDAVLVVNINTAKHVINWCWEQQYILMAKADELFAEFVRYHCKQHGVMHQLRHPGTGRMEDYWGAVPRKVFEYAVKDTQMTKLLRSAVAQVKNSN